MAARSLGWSLSSCWANAGPLIPQALPACLTAQYWAVHWGGPDASAGNEGTNPLAQPHKLLAQGIPSFPVCRKGL